MLFEIEQVLKMNNGQKEIRSNCSHIALPFPNPA